MVILPAENNIVTKFPKSSFEIIVFALKQNLHF